MGAGTGSGSEQRFKVQLAQRAVGKDHHRSVVPDQPGSRGHQYLIERLPVVVAAALRVFTIQQGTAIALDTCSNFLLRGERNERYFGRIDGP